MNNSIKIFVVIFIVLTFVNCSDDILFQDEKISITKSESNLTVTNRDEQTVYYFVVDQEVLPLINWAPNEAGKKIFSGNTTSINFNEITGLEEKNIEPGTKVVFYYWGPSGNSSYDVKSTIITLK